MNHAIIGLDVSMIHFIYLSILFSIGSMASMMCVMLYPMIYLIILYYHSLAYQTLYVLLPSLYSRLTVHSISGLYVYMGIGDDLMDYQLSYVFLPLSN